MFQLWKLAFLCGLLTGVSASLLETVGSDLSNVLENVDPVLQSGLQAVDSTLESVLQTLKSDLEVLQKSAVEELANNAQNLVHGLISAQEKLLNVKIDDLSVLDIQADVSSDGQGLTLRIPIVANVSAVLPLLGQVVNLQVKLDLLSTVKPGTDAQSGLSLGKCSSDPANISISLLNRRSRLVNSVLDSVSGLLENTVSLLLKNQICPLIENLTIGLSTDLLQNVISGLQNSLSVNV